MTKTKRKSKQKTRKIKRNYVIKFAPLAILKEETLEIPVEPLSVLGFETFTIPVKPLRIVRKRKKVKR